MNCLVARCINVAKFGSRPGIRMLSSPGASDTTEDAELSVFQKNEKNVMNPATAEIAAQNWSWIPPRNSADGAGEGDAIIPVQTGVYLSSSEIKTALEKQGGERVVVLNLPEGMDNIRKYVVVSGRSTKHLRKMADSIVAALKARNLTIAPGFTGREGGKDDDWVAVDCYNIVVHLMLPKTRRSVNLESHWSEDAKRPTIQYSDNEKIYEARFSKLLEEYPMPEDYGLDESEIEDQNSQPSNNR